MLFAGIALVSNAEDDWYGAAYQTQQVVPEPSGIVAVYTVAEREHVIVVHGDFAYLNVQDPDVRIQMGAGYVNIRCTDCSAINVVQEDGLAVARLVKDDLSTYVLYLPQNWQLKYYRSWDGSAVEASL